MNQIAELHRLREAQCQLMRALELVSELSGEPLADVAPGVLADGSKLYRVSTASDIRQLQQRLQLLGAGDGQV